MTPLRITAQLVSPLAVPLFPIALDALLGATVADERGLAGFDDTLIEVPLAWSECRRLRLGSVGHYHASGSVMGYLHRRAPVEEYKLFGGPKIRTVNTGTGPNKSHRIPQPRALVERMTWWAVGESDAVRRLLELVTHLGKRRAAGHGRVDAWTVEPCEPWPGFPCLRPDGTPMRSLPLDWPGIGPGASVGYGPLLPPYWDARLNIECAMPDGVEWSGPP